MEFSRVSIKFRFRIASGCKPRTLFVRTNGRLKRKKLALRLSELPEAPDQPDNLELDLRRYELRRGSRVLKLEKNPMELLILLVERRDQLVAAKKSSVGYGARMSSSTPSKASTLPFERSA